MERHPIGACDGTAEPAADLAGRQAAHQLWRRCITVFIENGIAASQHYPLTIAGESVGRLNAQAALSLRWPRWYAPSAQDRQQDAHTLKTLTKAQLLSHETATHILASDWDIGDVNAELQRIEQEHEQP